jgi:hypothetical protein
MITAETSSVLILDNKDLTTPVYELQSFSSICQALQWKYVRARVPICWKKLLHSRYMLANIVYLIYSIGFLVINFHPSFNEKSTAASVPTSKTLYINQNISQYYIILSILHLISASLYLWAWRDRSWFDIIMIPEYLNHIEAGLYLWSAFWYSKQDTPDGYYTLAVRKIEMTAAIIELFAAFGW